MIAFGQVPSRRLGQSLGMNNIPQKICAYSCIYCHLERTSKIQIKREAFYDPDIIVRDVEEKNNKVKRNNELINYFIFV